MRENFFDEEIMKLIEGMQDGYLYQNILLKLYLASLKYGGRLALNNLIPYSPDMIATITRHQVGTVQKALELFEKVGLIEVLDSGVIYMKNIENYIGKSSTDGDRKREQDRQVAAENRSSGEISDKSPTNLREISTIDNRNKKVESSNQKVENSNQQIANRQQQDDYLPFTDENATASERHTPNDVLKLFKQICVRLPQPRSVSPERERHINARFNQGFTIDDFRKAFEYAAASEFMNGNNGRKWKPDFDWFLNESNLTKTLEGKYNKNSNVDYSSADKPHKIGFRRYEDAAGEFTVVYSKKDDGFYVAKTYDDGHTEDVRYDSKEDCDWIS